MGTARQLSMLPDGPGAGADVLPGAVRYVALDAELAWWLRYDGEAPAESKPAVRYEEIFSCVPDAADPARLARAELSPYLLTVELTVPGKDVEEWNWWYHREHMPRVVTQMPGAEASRRFAPVGADRAASYLVVYEFDSREALWSWQVSAAVTERGDDYVARWGVRNVRHAFSAEPS
jgi:hypothetical protein